MKLVIFEDANGVRPGVLVNGGVVDAGPVAPDGADPHARMVALIDEFESRRSHLEALAASGDVIQDGYRLHAPLPRPRKILCCIGNYWEHAQREAKSLKMFLKNPDAVIGPGDVIELPDHEGPWGFQHEAELALIIKGPAKHIAQSDWRSYVFGYTCFIDVSARGEGRSTWPAGPPMSWIGKSFDSFAPIGPCIVTADEVEDPNDLLIRFWNDGQLRHNYNTDDMEHRVPELIEWASHIMTLNSGDIIACGTNHEGLGALQDGEEVTIEIEKIGSMSLTVHDPLKRTWERGVYMGADSTNPEAVLRHRREALASASGRAAE